MHMVGVVLRAASLVVTSLAGRFVPFTALATEFGLQ
jgi:hypothetical protein